MNDKSKGIRKDNGEWIHGVYGVLGENTELEKHVIMVSTLNNCGGNYFYFEDIEVEPETVCKYASRKDSKGDEVCEGDFFVDGDFYCIISYNETNAKWEIGIVNERITIINKNTPIEDYENLELYVNRVYIIGNIHDK